MSDTAPERRALYSVAGALTLAAAAVFVGFVVLLAHSGERAFAGLDAATAEIAFMSGKQFEQLGNLDQAVLRYRQALRGRFSNESRARLCRLSLADTLAKMGRYVEAIAEYEQLPKDAYATAGMFAGYVNALYRNGALDAAESQAGQWLALARSEGNRDQELWARSLLGRIYGETGRHEPALEQYQAAVKIDPLSQSAILEAQTLDRLGRHAEALARIDELIARVEAGQLREDALAVQSEIRSHMRNP